MDVIKLHVYDVDGWMAMHTDNHSHTDKSKERVRGSITFLFDKEAVADGDVKMYINKEVTLGTCFNKCYIICIHIIYVYSHASIYI